MKTEKLEKLHACREAVKYVTTQKSAVSAWRNCPRGDWMLWLAYHLKVNKRLLTLAKGKCAETVLHLMKDQRSKDAVKAAIDYGNGVINDEELVYTAAYNYAAAAIAAYDAAYAADFATTADVAATYTIIVANSATAASDSAYAAIIDNADSTAAYSADAAADAVTTADFADAADNARLNNQLLTANICREILTKEVLNAYKKLKP